MMNNHQEHDKKSSRALPFMLLAAIVLISYSGMLKADFVYDDTTQLVENVALRSLKNIPTFFTDPAHTSGSMIFEEIYRPLRATVFAVEYQLWGHNPAGYHAVNMALHMLNAFLVFLFITRIVGSSTPAFCASLLFAVHPGLTENVCWVCSLSDILCMFFYMIALLSFLSAREASGSGRNARYILSLVTLVLALFSKEMAVTFPAAIVAIDIWREGFKRQSLKRWMEYAPFVIITLAFLVFRATVMSQFAQRPPWGETPFHTFAIMSKGIVYYVRLLLFPFKLSALPNIDTNVSLLAIETLLSEALVIGLLVFAFAFRRRYPETTLGVILFFILLLPVSNIVPIKAVVGDRFIYILSLGFFIIAASLFRTIESSRSESIPRMGALTAGATGIVVFLFSINTIVRSLDWRDNFSLYSSAVEVAPDNPRAHLFLGKEYVMKGDYETAREHCMVAIRERPGWAEAHVVLGSIFLKEGLLRHAEKELKIATQHKPLHGDANNTLGIVYMKMGKYNEALVTFKTALEKNPEVSEILNNVASALIQMGEHASSLEYLNKALEVKPDNRQAAANAAISLIKLQRYGDAIALIENWLAHQAGDAQVFTLLGNAYAGAENYDAAVGAFSRAAAADPSDLRASLYMASLHMEYEEYEKAASIYRYALARYPAAPSLRISLASALESMDRLDEAIKELKIGIRLNPAEAAIHKKLGELLEKAGRHADAEKEYKLADRLASQPPEKDTTPGQK